MRMIELLNRIRAKGQRFRATERVGIKGHYRVLARPAGETDAPWELVAESDNCVCNDGFHMVGYALIDEATKYDTGITYCAIGTDNTTPAATDTDLGAEEAREPITTDTYTEGTKTLLFRTFFAAADCSINMKEAGLFGTSDATSSADSGEMFNHALVSYDNSGGTKDLIIEVEIVLAEGS